MDVQPKKPTVRGPAESFTGDAFIDNIVTGFGDPPVGFISVHFAPGARTAWHRHSIGQTLWITEGEGRAQARGGERITMRPGDVVVTPGGEWHWHGAAPAHFMTHLSIVEGDAEWGDHVTDAEYEGES